jgi:8-oxo-dGTP diphosphatase
LTAGSRQGKTQDAEPNTSFRLAVKAIHLDPQGRCLLLRRSPVNRSFVGPWEWPGGKVDEGEDFARAVVRETREECDLEVALTGVGGVTSFTMPVGQIVLLCMEVRPTGGEMRLSPEHEF